MRKVLITDSIHESFITEMHAAGFVCDYFPLISSEEVHACVAEYEVLIINSKILVNKALLDRATNLKLVGRLGSGLEIIDLDYAAAKGVKVFSSPEGNRDAVAEHVLAMLLSLMNQLNLGHADVVNFTWNREARRGHELGGKTVGIIGYGNTGKALAKKLKGFDVNVLFYDKYIDLKNDPFAKQVSLEIIYKEADIISFHLPYNEETHYFFNQDFADKMKKAFYLVNTSRGKIVESAIFLSLLREEKLLGLCLDVFENEQVHLYCKEEKQMISDLNQTGKALFSPHVAGWTKESKIKLAKILSLKIIEFTSH